MRKKDSIKLTRRKKEDGDVEEEREGKDPGL
jgi:hypothetical protein